MTLKQANVYLHVQVCEGRKTFICYLVGVNVLSLSLSLFLSPSLSLSLVYLLCSLSLSLSDTHTHTHTPWHFSRLSKTRPTGLNLDRDDNTGVVDSADLVIGGERGGRGGQGGWVGLEVRVKSWKSWELSNELCIFFFPCWRMLSEWVDLQKQRRFY